MKNYGNTFNSGRESLEAGKLPLWNSIDELFPSGCTLNGQTKGTTVKAGTPVYVPTMGGEATVLTDAAPNGVTGLLYEDVYIGTDGATGTVVVKGSILASRVAALSEAVKTALGGRITLIEE